MTLRSSALWCGVAIAFAAIAAYLPAFSGGFLWDDDAHITANPAVLQPGGLTAIWTSAKANYSPLTMTSFWLEHRLWGLSPRPYHVVTVLFHAAAAVMLWLVLRQLRVAGAWLGACLWALHPVQVESVAWICELKNTQSAFFFLVAIWFFVRWLQASGALGIRRDYVVAVVAAVFAILSKSSTVMLPIVLGLVGWWMGRRRWADARWLVPFFAISLLASVWTIWEQKVNSMASGAEWGHGMASRCVIAGKIVWFYLGKLLWPQPLVFIYPRWDVNDLGLLAWLPLIAALAVGAWLWARREGGARPLFFGLGYFVISLFPVLGFFDVFFFRYSFVGDHLQYLASMGPLALVGAGLATGARHAGTRRAAWQAAAVGVAIILGLLTWHQARIYRSNFALWENTVALNENAWIARVNFGVELVAAGRPADAIPQYEAALRLKPQFKEIEINLGGALLQTGHAAEAIPHLERALEAKYGRADALNALALALFQIGRTAEALSHYEEAVRLRPEFEAARFNFGNALIHAGRLPEAVEQYRVIVRSAPRSVAYRMVLARTLVALGQAPEALEHFRAAAEIAPGDFDAQCSLASVLAMTGADAWPEAVAHADAAVRAQPGAAEAYFCRASVLMVASRLDDARRDFERALQLRPEYGEARLRLAGTLYQLGRVADALPHYEALLRASPDSADAHNNLGSALFQLGRFAEALPHYESAVRLQPENLEARLNFALALAAAGRSVDAIAQCREVLQRRPDHERARQLLSQFEAAPRERDAAKK